MKQIVVISGKGGTGKTVITGSIIALAKNKVSADCDVDAADLHLLLSPEIKESHVFKSGVTAFINKDLCTECGLCRKICRFDAVSDNFVIDPVSCEGCSFCSHVCPVGAIEMQENTSGEWYVSDTRFGSLVHAKLGIAEENSGKLVSLVREQAKELAQKQKAEWVIVDGAPGVGCPVIASLSGIDCAVVVTEPTLSGLHDAERVIKVAKHFGVESKMVINKYDLNLDMVKKIERYCRKNGIEILGKVPFDKNIVKAMVNGKTFMESGKSKASEELVNIWKKLSNSFKT